MFLLVFKVFEDCKQGVNNTMMVRRGLNIYSQKFILGGVTRLRLLNISILLPHFSKNRAPAPDHDNTTYNYYILNI